jgi:hypothetical protein
MLQGFLPELEPFFKQMLESVTVFYHSHMAGLLKLCLVAQGPLNFMVYHFHDKEHDDVNFVTKIPVSHLQEHTAADLRRQMVMRLSSLCKGLLEIDRDDNVQFIHRTVRDWLMSGPMQTYLNHETRAHWNGKISLVQCHLGWYKCPTFKELVSVPLLSALSYGNLICEYNDTNSVRILNKILDELLSVTKQLEHLGFNLPGSNNIAPAESGDTASLVLLKFRLFKSGAWDYLSMKLDKEPGFLDSLARLPLAIDVSSDKFMVPLRVSKVRSKVTTSFQDSLLRQSTEGSTTDPVRSLLALEFSEAEVRFTSLQILLYTGAKRNPSHALMSLQNHGLPGLLIRLFLTGYDCPDLPKSRSYVMAKLELARDRSDIWSTLCAQVSGLGYGPETGNESQAADFLMFAIFHYLRIRSTWAPSDWQWD